VVAELRGKLATMQVPAIAPTIDHHFDVFHVEVKLIEAAKKYFEAGTKTFRVSGADDSAAKKAVKAASAALPKGWSRHAGLMELLREQHNCRLSSPPWRAVLGFQVCEGRWSFWRSLHVRRRQHHSCSRNVP
jgi:hypothetical protein